MNQKEATKAYNVEFSGGNLEQVTKGTYLQFWKAYSSVVATTSNREDMFMAALFAAYLNAPLLIIDNNDDLQFYANQNVFSTAEVKWIDNTDNTAVQNAATDRRSHFCHYSQYILSAILLS